MMSPNWLGLRNSFRNSLLLFLSMGIQIPRLAPQQPQQQQPPAQPQGEAGEVIYNDNQKQVKVQTYALHNCSIFSFEKRQEDILLRSIRAYAAVHARILSVWAKRIRQGILESAHITDFAPDTDIRRCIDENIDEFGCYGGEGSDEFFDPVTPERNIEREASFIREDVGCFRRLGESEQEVRSQLLAQLHEQCHARFRADLAAADAPAEIEVDADEVAAAPLHDAVVDFALRSDSICSSSKSRSQSPDSNNKRCMNVRSARSRTSSRSRRRRKPSP